MSRDLREGWLVGLEYQDQFAVGLIIESGSHGIRIAQLDWELAEPVAGSCSWPGQRSPRPTSAATNRSWGLSSLAGCGSSRLSIGCGRSRRSCGPAVRLAPTRAVKILAEGAIRNHVPFERTFN